MILFQNIDVYAPEYLGRKDVLTVYDKIVKIADAGTITADGLLFGAETVDGTGLVLTPGFVDCHVHVLGGGGEGGFAAAIDYMKGIGWEARETHEHALLDRMLAGMRAMPWLTVYGEPVAEGRYGVVSFNVNDVHPHDVATILDAGGVAVRAGHHCAQPLMEFLGIGSCCRASVAIYNTPEDVDALLENLENVRKVMGL